MPASIRVVGAEGVIKGFGVALKRYNDAVGAALYTEGLAMVPITDTFVPYQTGRLRGSHYCQPVRGYAGKAPWAKVGYAAPYAAAVNERTDARHEVGQAKFLEAGANAIRAGFASRVAANVANGVERGWSVSQVSSTIPKSSRTAVGRRRRKGALPDVDTDLASQLRAALKHARRRAKVPLG